MLTTRPANAAMSGSWVTSTIVMPPRHSSWNNVITSTLVSESRLPVGSSARITLGRVTSARAIATRCCWPPDIWLGWWSMRSASPTWVSASAARRWRSRAGTSA